MLCLTNQLLKFTGRCAYKQKRYPKIGYMGYMGYMGYKVGYIDLYMMDFSKPFSYIFSTFLF